MSITGSSYLRVRITDLVTGDSNVVDAVVLDAGGWFDLPSGRGFIGAIACRGLLDKGYAIAHEGDASKPDGTGRARQAFVRLQAHE